MRILRTKKEEYLQVKMKTVFCTTAISSANCVGEEFVIFTVKTEILLWCNLILKFDLTLKYFGECLKLGTIALDSVYIYKHSTMKATEESNSEIHLYYLKLNLKWWNS